MIWSLQWRHNGFDGVSNHQPHHCLLSRLFGRRSKKRSKLRVTGLCVGNSPETGKFPAQMASNAENVFIRWRHYMLDTARERFAMVDHTSDSRLRMPPHIFWYMRVIVCQPWAVWGERCVSVKVSHTILPHVFKSHYFKENIYVSVSVHHAHGSRQNLHSGCEVHNVSCSTYAMYPTRQLSYKMIYFITKRTQTICWYLNSLWSKASNKL